MCIIARYIVVVVVVVVVVDGSDLG